MKKRLFVSLLLGILIAVAGLYFSIFFADILGSSADASSVICGWGVYLCIVLVVCTGLILHKLEK